MVIIRQAAQAGDPGAMSHLGHMYANGLGVKQSNLTAIKWFKKGAAQGHQSGHYGLGYMYLTGYGTDVNLEKAFDHLIKVSLCWDQVSRVAFTLIGMMG